MRNKFAGTCYRCGEICPAGEGHFERTPFSHGWRVQHASCAIKHRGTDHGKDGESEKREAVRIRKLKYRAQQTGGDSYRARRILRSEYPEIAREILS